MLVRGLRREREFLVKTALGASRMRLLREVLLEALLLAAGAGLAALGVVVSGGSVMRRLFLASTTALASPIDTRVVLLTAVICLIAAFFLGLAPAVRLTRRRVLSPGHSAMVRPSWILDLFSAMQIALSVPMIVAAGLFVLSFWHARRQDLGMQTDRVAVVTTNLIEAGRPLENHATHRQIQRRIEGLPGIESTAVIQSMPMQGGTFAMIDVPGRERPKGPVSSDDLPLVNSVDPSFFSVMRMRLVDGRFFTDSDNRVGSPPVAVITESMARNYWPNARALGKCFYMNGRGGSCTEVIGVVRDARLFLSARPTNRWASACYLPIEQTSGLSSRAVLVRMTSDPDEALSMLRREAQTAVTALPYVDVHSFDEPFRNVLMPWRVGSTVFVVFGALSMIVASVGLAVVGAYAITRRTREIGIRAALGAAPRQLVHLVLRRSLMVVATGIAVGMVLAWAAGRILSAQLFDVTAGDARVFSGTALALLIVGGVAAWLPARRAARIDPAITLRAE
jgi:putative ABC transport system permease protein